jgi:hypothetical protein
VKLSPIANAPGKFRTYDGAIIDINEFRPFETSEAIDGLRWKLTRSVMVPYYVLQGWRFTCARWPTSGEEIQQEVRLLRNGRPVASSALCSLLTTCERSDSVRDKKCEWLDDILVNKSDEIEVLLTEQQVPPGARLRLHLRGMLLNLAR